MLILINIGVIWLHHLGDEQQAKVLYRESLSLWQDMQRMEQGTGIVKVLAGLAEVAAARGKQSEQGGCLGRPLAYSRPSTCTGRT